MNHDGTKYEASLAVLPLAFLIIVVLKESESFKLASSEKLFCNLLKTNESLNTGLTFELPNILS